MSQKIKSIQEELPLSSIDALFITNQDNVSYLTGFAGLAPHERESFLLVTNTYAYLLTFPTYYAMYKDGGSDFETRNITMTKRLRDHLQEIIEKHSIKTIGFESENLTVAELSSLKSKLSISFVQTNGTVEKYRVIKTKDELEYISHAAVITDQAFDFICPKLTAGVSEREIALELEYFMKKKADDIAFSPIVAFNENAAIPHYMPSSTITLKPNSLILLDFGAKYHGYCADMTRVVFLGTPNQTFSNVYTTVLEAQQKALSAISDGKAAAEIDILARNHIIEKGYPEYQHGLGHGVGRAIHEAPRLKKGSPDILKRDMVVTVEPGIYLEGNCGVRIEDLVVLKENGIDILSKTTKEMVIL